MIAAGWSVAVPAILAGASLLAPRRRLPADAPVTMLSGLLLALFALARCVSAPTTPGFWLDDPFGRVFLLLALLSWPVAAATAAAGPDGPPRSGWIGPRALAAAGAATACLANDLVVGVFGLGTALLGMRSERGDDPERLALAALALVPAVAGALLLAAATGAPARWSLLSARAVWAGVGSLSLPEAVLGAGLFGGGVLGVLLLALGPHRDGAEGRSAAAARPGLVAPVACCLLGRIAGIAPGHAMPRLALLVAAAMLGWVLLLGRGDDSVRLRAGRVRMVLGAAALIGVASGGGTALMGGMLALFALAIGYPFAMLEPPGRSLVRAALAGLPPFAPFAALLLVAERAFTLSAALALLLLAAAALTAVSETRTAFARDTPSGAETARPSLRTLRWTVLLLLLAGGALLPPVLSDFLSNLAPGAPG